MLPPLSADQAALLIERGAAAEALMQSAAFMSVVDDLTNYHLSQLVASPPGEPGRDAREHAHLMQYALTEICAEIQSRAEAGKQMQERLAEPEDNL